MTNMIDTSLLASAIPMTFIGNTGNGIIRSVHGKFYAKIKGVIYGKKDMINGYTTFGRCRAAMQKRYGHFSFN